MSFLFFLAMNVSKPQLIVAHHHHQVAAEYVDELLRLVIHIQQGSALCCRTLETTIIHLRLTWREGMHGPVHWLAGEDLTCRTPQLRLERLEGFLGSFEFINNENVSPFVLLYRLATFRLLTTRSNRRFASDVPIDLSGSLLKYADFFYERRS
nr:hypothetical protein CFP56_16886 [Quercus suber]